MDAEKTHVIMLSKAFPATSKRKGEPTLFKEHLLVSKIHTIRKNLLFWQRRIAEINKGEAYLSIRQWSGKPYCSRQIEIARLTKDDGMGIQELKFVNEVKCLIDGKPHFIADVAKNDGLDVASFSEWFELGNSEVYNETFAVIHFTKFRYDE